MKEYIAECTCCKTTMQAKYSNGRCYPGDIISLGDPTKKCYYEHIKMEHYLDREKFKALEGKLVG